MGLGFASAQFLIGEQRKGVDFGRTLTLGHQGVYMSRHDYRRVFFELNQPPPITFAFADEFFRAIGAGALGIMDNSAYEGADVIHDLNTPLPEKYKRKWTCVIDGGTLEHVFNFPEAVKTSMESVELGGHLILITPWHHFAGHGFYQFSPELFYRVLSIENGFTVKRMLIKKGDQWFSVRDPDNINSRVEVHSREPTLLYVSAERVGVVPIFSNWPQQSDYSSAWSEGSSKQPNELPSRLTFKESLVNRFEMVSRLQSAWKGIIARKEEVRRSSAWAHPVPQSGGIPL